VPGIGEVELVCVFGSGIVCVGNQIVEGGVFCFVCLLGGDGGTHPMVLGVLSQGNYQGIVFYFGVFRSEIIGVSVEDGLGGRGIDQAGVCGP
jgi:hypothetical protein